MANYAAPALATYPLSLVAGETTTVTARGRFLRVMEADAEFTISFDDGRPMTVERGIALSFPTPFTRITATAPGGASLTGVLAVTDGEIIDTRVTISAGAGLVVNVAKIFGAPLIADGGTLAANGSVGDSVAVIAALDSTIEWVELQNRGATLIAVSNAEDETAKAVRLEPGERVRLETGGPLWVTNIDAGSAGQWAALYGQRA